MAYIGIPIINGPYKDESGYYVCVARGVTGRYISHAKKVPFISNKRIRIDEPDDMWFEFGSTIEEALDNLKKTLP